jgi:uracil-DNA glycosylase
MQEEALEKWYFDCGRHFLRPLIELVQPEVAIALGKMATNGILQAYGLKTYDVLRKAVECEDGIRLSEKTRLFPVYHCGNRSVNHNRRMEQQLIDWKKIRTFFIN